MSPVGLEFKMFEIAKGAGQSTRPSHAR